MRAWLFGLVLMLLSGSGTAVGHPMPNSIVALDVGEAAIAGRITIPLIELDLALGTSFSTDPEALVPAAEEQISAYLSNHIGVTAPDGSSWDIGVGNIAVVIEAIPYAEIMVDITMTPPPGASIRNFTLVYNAVMHRVATHYAVVSVHEDWFGGRVQSDPSEIGIVRVSPVDGSVAPLTVRLSAGSYWQGFLALLGLGSSHIAEGTDHLLFLLTLILPAPLLARHDRWSGVSGTRQALLSIAAIVTAFTIGHSISLIAATLSRLELPQQPIEIVIAVTILVSAIHALRPVFPRREPFIAGIFGLVHGMAFSFTLADLDLSAPQLLVSLLGFNLGIELFQLAFVALTLPALLLFARSGVYRPVRIAGAALAMVASFGWLTDRLGGTSSIAIWADSIGQQLPWGVAILTILAVAIWAFQRRTSP